MPYLVVTLPYSSGSPKHLPASRACHLSVRLSLPWNLRGKARWVLALSHPPGTQNLPQMKFQGPRTSRKSPSANLYWHPPGLSQAVHPRVGLRRPLFQQDLTHLEYAWVLFDFQRNQLQGKKQKEWFLSRRMSPRVVLGTKWNHERNH